MFVLATFALRTAGRVITTPPWTIVSQEGLIAVPLVEASAVTYTSYVPASSPVKEVDVPGPETTVLVIACLRVQL